MVQLLLDTGADYSKENIDGETPLFWAVFNGQVDVVEVLLNGVPELNQDIGQGLTPLHLASMLGRKTVVQLLLARGADVNATVHRSGLTSLDFAAQGGHTDIVHILQGGDA